MKRIEKDELYENLAQFLQRKGIQLTDGSYAQTLHKSCRMMADIINLGQQGIECAKTGIDTKIDQVRQVIHEKTSPKGTASAAKPTQPESQPAEPQAAPPVQNANIPTPAAKQAQKRRPTSKSPRAKKSPKRNQ